MATDGNPKEYLKNTHNAYRLFYTILLTIGVSQGFHGALLTIKSSSWDDIHQILPVLFTFIVFLLIVIRFFLGGVRHLDATYIEEPFDNIKNSKVSSQLFRATDIGLLLIDAGLIIVLGAFIRSVTTFYLVFTVLLLIDSIWGFIISYWMDDIQQNGRFTPRFKWSINNSIHFFMLLCAILWFGWPALIITGISNSLADLSWVFDYYFPPLSRG